jgi:cob(I)alamin adenosyltransferase
VDHPRIEAIGEVDTLNSQVGVLLAGLARRAASIRAEGSVEVLALSAPLFDLGGELAMPEYKALNEAEVNAWKRRSIVERGAGAAGELHSAGWFGADRPGPCVPQPGAQRGAAVSAFECG